MHKFNSSQKIWYPLKEYPAYEINKDGQIRNAKTGKLRKIDYSSPNFAQIQLRTSNGNLKVVHVDELVASVFLTNKDPNRFDTLKHIDGNPYNCSVDNLIWAEYDYSKQHSILKSGRVKPKEYYTFYPLIEFPDSMYEINKMGQVRNKNTHKLLKGSIKSGYLAYTMYVDGKIVFRRAHALVARQFIPNPENKPLINHIDENKANPCVDNLEWVTTSENSSYGKAQEKTNIARSKPINEYSLQGEYIRTWRSATLLGAFFSEIYSTKQEQIRDYISKTIRINSREGTTKRPFGNRVFMQYKGECENVDFILSKHKQKKYGTFILDSIEIPEEYLINPNELRINYIEALKSLKIANAGLSYYQRQAIDYAIECMQKIEKLQKRRK